MGKYFGTDGLRGMAGRELTADGAFLLGRVLATHLKKKREHPRVVIGKDTRLSSYMLEYAIAAGIASMGADAYMLHVITTPGVSYVTATEGFDSGIMISASHNPYYDNGIKVMDSRGEKLSDADISEIEMMMDTPDLLPPPAYGDSVGRIVDYYGGRNRYIGHLISISAHSLKGLRIGLDAANGSAWMTARAVFESLGASVVTIGTEPNGININDGVGSTNIAALSRLVREMSLDMGFALDGDADRCIAVDERGEVVSGDHVLYILATDMKKRGEQGGNRVVTTVMSNLGLYRALDMAGIGYEKTAVGDRYVKERMDERGIMLGGEQSGHTIIAKHASTGDGILTAIKLTECVLESKMPLSRLAEPVKMLPQVLINVRVEDKDVLESDNVKRALHLAELELSDCGRILVRKSGTEPLVRIMVECDKREDADTIAKRVADAIESEAKTRRKEPGDEG